MRYATALRWIERIEPQLYHIMLANEAGGLVGGGWKAVFECRPAGYWLYMAHVVADTPPLTSSANWQCEKTLTFVNAFPDARQVDMDEVVQRDSG